MLYYLYWPNINSISNIKSESRETYEDVPNGPVEVKDTIIETEAKETDKENVIQVKEYSPNDDDNDIVFVQLASWYTSKCTNSCMFHVIIRNLKPASRIINICMKKICIQTSKKV